MSAERTCSAIEDHKVKGRFTLRVVTKRAKSAKNEEVTSVKGIYTEKKHQKSDFSKVLEHLSSGKRIHTFCGDLEGVKWKRPKPAEEGGSSFKVKVLNGNAKKK